MDGTSSSSSTDPFPLCLLCSSTIIPSYSNLEKQPSSHPLSAAFLTPCCQSFICHRCIDRNPRVKKYDPCLKCGGGIGLVVSGSKSTPGKKKKTKEERKKEGDMIGEGEGEGEILFDRQDSGEEEEENEGDFVIGDSDDDSNDIQEEGEDDEIVTTTISPDASIPTSPIPTTGTTTSTSITNIGAPVPSVSVLGTEDLFFSSSSPSPPHPTIPPPEYTSLPPSPSPPSPPPPITSTPALTPPPNPFNPTINSSPNDGNTKLTEEKIQADQTDQCIIHYIKKDESLRGISLKYGVDAHHLLILNHLPPQILTTSPQLLHSHRPFLLIPPSTTTTTTTTSSSSSSSSSKNATSSSSPSLTSQQEQKQQSLSPHPILPPEEERLKLNIRRFQMTTKVSDWGVAKSYLECVKGKRKEEARFLYINDLRRKRREREMEREKSSSPSCAKAKDETEDEDDINVDAEVPEEELMPFLRIGGELEEAIEDWKRDEEWVKNNINNSKGKGKKSEELSKLRNPPNPNPIPNLGESSSNWRSENKIWGGRFGGGGRMGMPFVGGLAAKVGWGVGWTTTARGSGGRLEKSCFDDA